MTTEERTFYISVIEKMAKGEDVSDEELIRFSGDDNLFTPFIGRTDVTDEELQQIADNIPDRHQEPFRENHTGYKEQDDDFFDEFYLFTSITRNSFLFIYVFFL